MSDVVDDRDRRIEELEHRAAGLRRRVEKLGGEVVRSEYKTLHLTQEVRRSREAFGFLTGFQNSIGRVTSLGALYETALKSIVSELWMKRAVALGSLSDGTLMPVAQLGYADGTEPSGFKLPPEDEGQWTSAQLVNGETPDSPWIEAVREALGIPYFVWIPTLEDGSLANVIVAGNLAEDAAQEPRLTGHDLDLFVSMGAILWVGRMNLVARRGLRRQVQYEALLHKISEVLLKDYDAPTSHFDDVLRRVGIAWSLDRVRLLTRAGGERLTQTSHQWTAQNTADDVEHATYPLETIPRLRDAMACAEKILINDVEELPEEEAAPLRDQGIKSLLVIPIMVHRAVVGWSSYEQCSESRSWSAEDAKLLEVISGLTARAMARETEIQERMQLEAEYNHSKKMEAVGQLAGGVAHDFNNLLTTIQGYAQLLMSRLPEEYRDMPGLKEIIMASERAAGLTRQLLTFSRKDTASTGAIEINTAIKDMMKLLTRMLGDSIKQELDLGEGMSTIVGDHQQICQMVMNLAINARDAMPEGGSVRITTREIPVSSSMAHRFSIPGIERCQVIEVADTGTGMDEETKERIFEPFFTTKGEGRGTGLGLSIAFSVVRRHGGFIDVSSALGEGTAFSIYIPVRAPEEEEEEHSASLEAKGGDETILIVEDDEGVRTMICEVLTSQGYDILAAKNGREALDALGDSRDSVSLVMTDVVMPEMGGHEMWRSLMEQGFDVPVIVMSGFPKGKDAAELLEGAALYLQKPFGPKEISRAVRETLDGRHEVDGTTPTGVAN